MSLFDYKFEGKIDRDVSDEPINNGLLDEESWHPSSEDTSIYSKIPEDFVDDLKKYYAMIEGEL